MSLKKILISTVILLAAACTPSERIPTIFRDHLKDGSQGPEMVWIPGGTFKMGDIQGNGTSYEQQIHWVSVSRFAMGRYEVTVGEFQQFVNATRYKTDAEKGDGCYAYNGNIIWNRVKDANWRNPKFSQNENHPVVCVSWNDASAYAEWLSRQTGQAYRLPTEAEWEYAARADTTTSRYWGNNPDYACRYANVADKTAIKTFSNWTIHNCTDGYVYTAPVGNFKANRFDLFDTLGNVWEWTCSEYQNLYAGSELGCAEAGSRLALRGGSWADVPELVRADHRNDDSHDDRDVFVGIRLARSS